jgi:putative protease
MMFRNFDHKFEATLNKDSATRKITVDMKLFDTDDGVGLTITDVHNISASATLICDKAPANDQAKTADNLKKQLGKLGSSDFVLNKVNLHTAQMWFLPASMINELRRDAVSALMAARVAAYKRPERWVHDKSARFPQKALSFLSNVANEKAKSFYEQHGVIQIEDTYEKNTVLHDAPLMVTKHCLRYSFNLCPKEVEGIKAEPMFLDVGKDKLKLVFDCHKCEMMIVGSNQLVKQQ